jgi:hypothetical protein
MGSSKIVFVGAVAVIIGLFGFGIKKAEKKSADIATAHAYQLQAKTLAERGLQVATQTLPRNAHAVINRSFVRETNAGTYGYTTNNTDLPATQARITSYGIMNGQKATLISTLEELPAGPRPGNVKSWNGWKVVSSVRTFEVIEP